MGREMEMVLETAHMWTLTRKQEVLGLKSQVLTAKVPVFLTLYSTGGSLRPVWQTGPLTP